MRSSGVLTCTLSHVRRSHEKKTGDEYCVDADKYDCHQGDRHTPFRDCSDTTNLTPDSPCWDQGADAFGNPNDVDIYYQFWEEECSIDCHGTHEEHDEVGSFDFTTLPCMGDNIQQMKEDSLGLLDFDSCYDAIEYGLKPQGIHHACTNPNALDEGGLPAPPNWFQYVCCATCSTGAP